MAAPRRTGRDRGTRRGRRPRPVDLVLAGAILSRAECLRGGERSRWQSRRNRRAVPQGFPRRWKDMAGTVAVTSVGMFGRGSG